MQLIAQDVRFAIRTLRRRALFSAVVIATMAVSVGAATSVYSVVDGVLLRPLPFHEPDRLVALWQTFDDWRREPVLAARWDRIPFSFPEYRDLGQRARTLSGIAIWSMKASRLEHDGRADVVTTVAASSSLLSVLGARPLLGRMFLPGEDVPNAGGVALVSHDQWRSRYGADARILGRVVRIDERSYTIIGVLPPGFTLGRTSERDGPPPAFWLPAGQTAGSLYASRRDHNYHAVARLAPGATMESAADEITALLHSPFSGDARAHGTRLVEWHTDQTREARGPLFLLLGAVGLLVLIACANVATLLLGEGAAREQEMAARLALGARRSRLLRQLMTECLVLAVVGGASGTALAWGGTRALVALAPAGIPGLHAVHMDLRVFAFALVTIVGTGLLFGLVPGLTATRTSASTVLHAASRHVARDRAAFQRALVAGELALSAMLLVGAGLLVRSFDRLTSVDPGFAPDGVLVAETTLPLSILEEAGAVQRLYEAALARTLAIPGVRSASVATNPPFAGRPGSSDVRRTGDGEETAGRSTEHRTVSPTYFATLGIPLLQGRGFSSDDRAGSALVAIVSEASARRDFPSGSPIGHRVMFLGEWRTIVGVVGDVRHSRLASDVQPAIYMPLAQRDMWTLTVVVRVDERVARANAAPVIAALRRAIDGVDSRLSVTTTSAMPELIRRSVADERYRALLVLLFGVLALLLSAVGVYGVTSRAVVHRRRELGIRLALGATPREVVRQIVGSSLAGVAAGVSLGLAGAVLLNGVIAPFLFGVPASDPVTFAGVVAVLVVVSIGASWVPARRAGREEVVRVLHAE